MRRFLRTTLAGLCLALMLGAGAPVEAQTVQKLVIEDGNVRINDQLVPADDLPESLDVSGITATYTFNGNLRPLIELNGALFVLDGQQLRSMADLRNEQGGMTVYFRDDAGVYAGRYDFQPNQGLLSVSIAEEQGQALRQYSDELGRLRGEVNQQQATQVLEQAQFQIARAAEAVQLLPTLEVQNYLNDVQRNDQNLYSLLLQELRMEREAETLAWQIRALAEGEQRHELIGQLQNKLQETFELKQQNRRMEIEQLEQELTLLNERLLKREQWRAEMIQQRLEQLIGVQPSPNN